MGEKGITTRVIVAAVVVIVAVLASVYCLIFARGVTTLLYDIYPDTDEAPVLEFLWGPSELQLSQIVRVSPYGAWEGSGGVYENEPATEIEVVTTTTHNPVYAPCPGTVTSIYVDEVIDGVTIREVTIRYGRNYAVTQHHLVDVPDNLVLGMKIETGTLLGCTQTYTDPLHGEVGFWELELLVKQRRRDLSHLAPVQLFHREFAGEASVLLGCESMVGPRQP